MNLNSLRLRIRGPLGLPAALLAALALLLSSASLFAASLAQFEDSPLSLRTGEAACPFGPVERSKSESGASPAMGVKIPRIEEPTKGLRATPKIRSTSPAPEAAAFWAVRAPPIPS